MNIDLYKAKYLKYKTKYNNLKFKQVGNGIDFKNFPCSIYHAFHMKFTDIIAEIPKLKAMGFTHIQPSPIQKCREKIGPVLMKKKKMEVDYQIWWLAYQPESYNIGNFYGTEEEFKQLVKVAKENGIEIVVDVVINHLQASQLFEYAIWNIIIILSKMDENELDTENTLWNVYNKFNFEDIKIEAYMKNIEDKKNILQEKKKILLRNTCGETNRETVQEITNINMELNNIDDKIYTIKKFIFMTLYEKNDITSEIFNSYESVCKNENEYDVKVVKDQISELINQQIAGKYDQIDQFIIQAFEDLKDIICKFLGIELQYFKPEYYDIITPPYWCSSNIKFGYNCWLGQALPQLNQKNKIVIYKTFEYLKKLHELGIKCLRIDAASHIQPKILKLYKKYFDKLTDNNNYIYSEVINPDGTATKLNIHDYSRITHITEYNLLLKLIDTFCFNCNLNNLSVLQLPSGDVGSVVFSSTHDLEKIDGAEPALSRFGDYNKIYNDESYKIILMICYLLQRIYNVPLVFKTQIENEYVIECCKFRKELYDKGCNKEYSETIDNTIFRSTKYLNEQILGIFYMNVSEANRFIDGFDIPPRGIFIKKNY